MEAGLRDEVWTNTYTQLHDHYRAVGRATTLADYLITLPTWVDSTRALRGYQWGAADMVNQESRSAGRVTDITPDLCQTCG